MLSTSIEMPAYARKCAKDLLVRIVNQSNRQALTLGNVQMPEKDLVETSR